jgi:glycosyltransferase involved in cell wall biosynthesis
MRKTTVSHLLIFEPDPRGHTPEWVEHLLRYALEERCGIPVTFAVAPELADTLSTALGEGTHPDIRIERLTENDVARCLSPHFTVSAFSRWRLMRRHLKRARASHGLFLCLDHLSLPLALGLRSAGRRVSGILFRPSIHYRGLSEHEPTLRERVRDLRKRILYALMLRNPALSRVFSLDPYFSGHSGLRSPNRKVRCLADPAFPLSPAPAENPDALPDGRALFLLFGSLTERKGILVLLDALRHLHPLAADRCAVLIAGGLDPALRGAVDERLAALARLQPSLWIELRDAYIPANELAALVHRSDVILAPYQRFVGSSGVMIWAAGAGKPIVTQDYGLLGKFARDYALGHAVDTTDPAALCDAIASIVHNGTGKIFDPKKAGEFLADRSPRHFAATLFDGFVNDSMPAPSAFVDHPSAARTGHASSLS